MPSILEQISYDGKANAWLQEELSARFDERRPNFEAELKLRNRVKLSNADDDNELERRAVEEAKSVRAALTGPHTRSLLRNTYRLAFDQFTEDELKNLAELECYNVDVLKYHFNAEKRLSHKPDSHPIREFPVSFLVNGPMKRIMEGEIGTATIRKIFLGLEQVGLMDIVPCVGGNGSVAYRFDIRLKLFVETWYQIRNGELRYDRSTRKIFSNDANDKKVVPMKVFKKNYAAIALAIAATMSSLLSIDTTYASASKASETIVAEHSQSLNNLIATKFREVTLTEPLPFHDTDSLFTLSDASSAQDFWDALKSKPPRPKIV